MIKSVMVDGAEALKLMVDGAVAWERSWLPAGYRRCKYLESTGEQAIDLPYIPCDISLFHTKIEFTAATSGVIFGGRQGEGNAMICFVFENNLTFYLDYGSGSGGNRISGSSAELNKIYTLKIGNRFVYDEESGNYLIKGSKVSFQRLIRPISLFALGSYGSGDKVYDSSSHMKMYWMRILEADVLIHNMIPALDASDRPCMYDTVTKQPFYNMGTGEFLYELA